MITLITLDITHVLFTLLLTLIAVVYIYIYIYIYIGEDDIRKVMTSTLGPEVNNPNNPDNPTNFLGMTVIGLSPT